MTKNNDNSNNKNKEEKDNVMKFVNGIKKDLIEVDPNLKVDNRDNYSPGFKFNEWEKKRIPIRLEIGPKDVKKKQVVLVRRDSGIKKFVDQSDLKGEVKKLLDEMQNNLFKETKKFRQENSFEIDDYDEFKTILNDQGGGFIYSHWCGNPACEEEIKQSTKATIRCIPFEQSKERGKCIVCAKRSNSRVIFAKAY